MCALVATVNTSDKTLIPAAREYYLRQMNVGTAWTQIRIGMFFTIVPSGNDDAASVAESVTVNDYKDLMAFGLKDSSANAPFSAGSKFIGISQVGVTTTLSVSSNSAGSGLLYSGGGQSTNAYTANGATVISSNGAAGIAFAQYSATSVNAFWGMKYIVTNAGLSSQALSPHRKFEAGPFSDVTKEALTAKLLDASGWTDMGVSQGWNSGGAALALLDHLYFRLPLYNNRLRLTTYGAVLIS